AASILPAVGYLYDACTVKCDDYVVAHLFFVNPDVQAVDAPAKGAVVGYGRYLAPCMRPDYAFFSSSCLYGRWKKYASMYPSSWTKGGERDGSTT
ncbi:MAG TPA: hypothetical protein VNI77_10675, partial [Nitrososphaera sp.]|nr:hypothetical protein [Nitrososphaera sp.]